MSLADFYVLQFQLHRYHHYAWSELESMIPFERDVMVNLLLQVMEQERLSQAAVKNR